MYVHLHTIMLRTEFLIKHILMMNIEMEKYIIKYILQQFVNQ